MTLKRIWQITQALVFTASVVLFLLIVGGYGLLVFFAHDARSPFSTTKQQNTEFSPVPPAKVLP